MGSGVPWGREPMPYCEAKDRAENWEPADVGLLARPSRGPKLPDLEWAALLSLPPLVEAPVWIWTTGRGACSWGLVMPPIGVESWSWSCGRLGGATAAPAPPTAFWFGDGGMASPSLGARPPVLGLLTPRAGRKGAGEGGIMGRGVDIGCGTLGRASACGGVWTRAGSETGAEESWSAMVAGCRRCGCDVAPENGK